MSNIELTWLHNHRYLGVDSTRHSVVISPPGDVGVKPSDLLLIGLAACTAYDVVEIIQKRRARLDRLTVRVAGEQASEAPWAYRGIHLHFEVIAADLSRVQLERAVDLALNKYCSVRASLSPDIEISFEVELQVPESGAL
ncbi:MAG TPA: osmotically inducible protein OsmC [Chloroflexi bacterium]|nr:osmotically inducible protein OsmC [Chloroflexota bacterium]